MPAPHGIDREQVKMLALAIGVRPAARKLGIPEDTVCSWAKRENWMQATKPVQAVVELPPTMRPQAVQAKPVDVLADTIAEDSQACRTHALAYSRRVLAYSADQAQADPEAARAAAAEVKAAVQAAAQAGNWTSQASPTDAATLSQVNIQLNIER